MKYLVIFEDGGMKQYDKISEEDIEMVADGYCTIIRIQKYSTNFEFMMVNGEWGKVDDAKSGGEE